MPTRPMRMRKTRVQVRLQKTAPDLLVDPIYGNKASTIPNSFQDIIVLKGQVRFFRSEDHEPAQAGDRDYTSGWITFSTADLAAEGITDPTVMKNGLLVGIERIKGTFKELNYMFTEPRPRGHISQPIIWKVFFEVHYDERGTA